MGCISPVFGLFRYLGAHFLDVEGDGEEGKVHCDLVFAGVAEASVCHVELHLAEDGLRFDAASSPVPEAFLGCQQFTCFSFIFVEPMVYLDGSSVALRFIA